MIINEIQSGQDPKGVFKKRIQVDEKQPNGMCDIKASIEINSTDSHLADKISKIIQKALKDKLEEF